MLNVTSMFGETCDQEPRRAPSTTYKHFTSQKNFSKTSHEEAIFRTLTLTADERPDLEVLLTLYGTLHPLDFCEESSSGTPYLDQVSRVLPDEAYCEFQLTFRLCDLFYAADGVDSAEFPFLAGASDTEVSAFISLHQFF